MREKKLSVGKSRQTALHKKKGVPTMDKKKIERKKTLSTLVSLLSSTL